MCLAADALVCGYWRFVQSHLHFWIGVASERAARPCSLAGKPKDPAAQFSQRALAFAAVDLIEHTTVLKVRLLRFGPSAKHIIDRECRDI